MKFSFFTILGGGGRLAYQNLRQESFEPERSSEARRCACLFLFCFSNMLFMIFMAYMAKNFRLAISFSVPVSKSDIACCPSVISLVLYFMIFIFLLQFRFLLFRDGGMVVALYFVSSFICDILAYMKELNCYSFMYMKCFL